MTRLSRLLAVALLLATASTASATLPLPCPTPVAAAVSTAGTYQDAYAQGLRETLQNKCIDGNNFYSNYANSYEPRAQRNYDYSQGTADEDYFRGYLDGLHEGYMQPAYCGGSNPGGGGSNPGGNPCPNCPIEPQL